MWSKDPVVEGRRFEAEAIITSFLLGATIILLSLDVSVIKSSTEGLGSSTIDWLLALSLVVMLLGAMIILFLSFLSLQTLFWANLEANDRSRRIVFARRLLGIASALIPASFGSTFLLSFGLSNPWSFLFAGIGYGSGILWYLMREYYVWKLTHLPKN